MNVRTLADADAVRALLPAWRSLLDRAARPEVVMSPVWALAWWRELGHDGGRSLRGLAVEDGGRLVGLALLASRRALHRRVVPVRRLELWMTGEPHRHEIWSKYVGVLAEAGRERAVASALVGALVAGGAGRFDQLTIERMSSDDVVLPALAAALRSHGFDVLTSTGADCPYARLAPTWGAYLDSLDGTARDAVQTALVELEAWAAGRPIELSVASDASTAREGLAVLRRLHAERWAHVRGGDVFASPRFARFHEAVIPRLVGEGHLDLLCLRVGGEPVAALYNLTIDGRSQVYQSGRLVGGVPPRLSLGLAAHAWAIQRAIARGDREYDFLGGAATSYKRQLSTSTRSLVDLVATPPGLRAVGLSAAKHLVDGIVERARPWIRGTSASVAPATPADTQSPGEESPPTSLAPSGLRSAAGTRPPPIPPRTRKP